MTKLWAGVTIIGISIYFILLIALTTYGEAWANEVGINFGGNATDSVSLNQSIEQQSSCDYPRYRYTPDGEQSKFNFDLDNTDCGISVGALGENECNAVQGCSWENTTSGFLFFSSQEESCVGDINKTYYNDGVATSKDMCLMDGLQGDKSNCQKLGCTVYEPQDDFGSGDVGFLSMFQQVSDLFTFRYDFGFEGILSVVSTLLLVWLPSLIVLLCLYILSPFSL